MNHLIAVVDTNTSSDIQYVWIQCLLLVVVIVVVVVATVVKKKSSIKLEHKILSRSNLVSSVEIWHLRIKTLDRTDLCDVHPFIKNHVTIMSVVLTWKLWSCCTICLWRLLTVLWFFRVIGPKLVVKRQHKQGLMLLTFTFKSFFHQPHDTWSQPAHKGCTRPFNPITTGTRTHRTAGNTQRLTCYPRPSVQEVSCLHFSGLKGVQIIMLASQLLWLKPRDAPAQNPHQSKSVRRHSLHANIWQKDVA